MESPTHNRSVSELIEIWQDWSLVPSIAKRRRRWTMDDSIPPSSSVEPEEAFKKSHKAIVTSVSVPEEIMGRMAEEQCQDEAAEQGNKADLVLRGSSQNNAVENSTTDEVCSDSDVITDNNQRRDTSPLNQLGMHNHDRPDDLIETSSAQMRDDSSSQIDDSSNDVKHKCSNPDEIEYRKAVQPSTVAGSQTNIEEKLLDEKPKSNDGINGDILARPSDEANLPNKNTQTEKDGEPIDADSSTSNDSCGSANQLKHIIKSTTAFDGALRDGDAAPQLEKEPDPSLLKHNLQAEGDEKKIDLDPTSPPNNFEQSASSIEQPDDAPHARVPADDKQAESREAASSGRLQPISSLPTPKSQNVKASSQSTDDQEQQQQQLSNPLDVNENSSPNTNHNGSSEIHRKKLKDRSKKQSSRKRCSHIAVIEQDASFAFSPYRPIPKLSLNSSLDGDEKKGKTRQVRLDEAVRTVPTGDSSDNAHAEDPIESLIQHPHDPIMEQYLKKMNYVYKEYYSSKQPSRAGNRDLPLNQLEVVLRRRAIKKREAVQAVTIQNQSTSSSASVDEGTTQSSHNNSDNASTVGTLRGPSKSNLMYPPIPRPPLSESQSTASRRALFPASYGHARSHSLGMDTTFEDDSTISSTTVASAWTTGNSSAVTAANTLAIAQPLDSQTTSIPTQQRLDFSNNISSWEEQLPQEEFVGDTSLGLKLTILHGKVIVQSISPLDDGRASPAQLCGLFCPGDILIAVDGLSLINGSIHSPVPMDKMLAVLKPLSQPIEGGDGRYTREVRLRFVVGEGKKLLREQREREQRKQRIEVERKKMGLDGKAGAMAADPAADIFGLSALMGVDQHTGMPLFQQHHLETHHIYVDEDEEVEKSAEELLTADNLQVPDDIHQQSSSFPSLFNKTPPLLQSQIAHQVAVERQWKRSRNTSEFFTLDRDAPLLLRAPSPPATEQTDASPTPKLNPVEARNKRLELGAANISHAKEIVSIVEKQERGIDLHSDEDPMEVASRVCGTASVRTGASRRRWHRGDSVILEDAQSTVVSASSMDNQADMNTLRSGESIEACDHRLLVDLAANNQSWKMNVIKRLEEYATDTEKSSNYMHTNKRGPTEAPSSLDSLLFGRDVANILGKKKSSLALPPGEMTQMLFDLKEHLESGLPVHIFMSDDAFSTNNQEKAVTFAKAHLEKNADITKATDYLVNEALGVWLKSFHPLPWKQRRALWPLHLSGTNSEPGSMMSSHFDDGMSLSMMSGGTHSKAAADKRNLREIIEELELDPETRRETCSLVTFYFAKKFLPRGQTQLSDDEEKEAHDFINAYGSYLDLFSTMVLAGKLQSQSLIKQLVGLAKFDPQHRESMKAFQKAKVLLFYEPNMLSALHELLQLGAYNSMSSKFDIIRLLVSAYPDLTPMSVRAASGESTNGFYFDYLSLLMHPDEGSDAAKRDGELVKEWCSMLASQVEANAENMEDRILSFHHVASTSDESSSLYRRPLPFLLEVSIKISEYDLALEIAKEMLSSKSLRKDEFSLADIVQHLRQISDIAISGEINSSLLSQVVAFYTDMCTNQKENLAGFDIVSVLSKLFQQCADEAHTNSTYDLSRSLVTCLTVVSENAPPSDGLQVLSNLELTGVDFQDVTTAIHTLLIRGARKNVGKEISGSLLRIQRAREEGRCVLEESMGDWNYDTSATVVDEDESEGFIWPNILEGSVLLSK